MKLSKVKNYSTLVEYVKQNPNLELKKYNPPHPPYNLRGELQILIHYQTPIAYLIGKEIYCPHYVKENFISMTTAKISTQICEFAHVLSMDGFLYRLYDELSYPIIEKNQPFYNKYVDSLIGQ